jgi:hypothetical protein
LWLKGNGLRWKQSHKTGKTQKKVQNNFRRTPVFLQNGPEFRAKTGHDQMRHLQVALVVRVRQYEKTGAATIRRGMECQGLANPNRYFRHGIDDGDGIDRRPRKIGSGEGRRGTHRPATETVAVPNHDGAVRRFACVGEGYDGQLDGINYPARW